MERIKRSKTYEPKHDRRKPCEHAKIGQENIFLHQARAETSTRGSTAHDKHKGNPNIQKRAFFSLKSPKVQEWSNCLIKY
jgi:hypothetical protein